MVKPISVQEASQLSSEKKEQLLSNIEKEAFSNEVKYWGCAQAVLAALQSNLAIGNGEAFKAATTLAGGVGGLREACGALTGGVLAIGLAYGRERFIDGKVTQEQPEAIEASARANLFCNRFKERFNSVRCSDIRVSIRGANYKEFTRRDTIEAFEDHNHCANVTGPAARLAAEVILLPQEPFVAIINSRMEELVRVRQLQQDLRNKK